MRRKKRLLLDCDGVMTDFYGHAEPWVLEFFRQNNLVHPPRNEIVFHEYFDRVLTKDIEKHFWAYVDSTPGWTRDMPLLPNTREAVSELRKMVDLRCVTSQHDGPYWVRERFATLQSLGFTKKTAYFTAGKEAVGGDMFIDDTVHHVRVWAEEQVGARAILRVHPEFAPVAASVWSDQISTWGGILAAVEKMIEEG